ncbi:class I SAM-dependent methyltransferase [Rubrolithibacter danxiaensis]|uniref:class I SAM-dependent methyltransferase n=1 Tax=Rubrolithibacter danxiaensis TaxID=3390805 RepID=UPI003BF89082
MKSKITGRETQYLFTAKILNKYEVKYYQCKETGFIQTEEPFWLPEAYSKPITETDLGLIYRNIILSKKVAKLIFTCLNHTGTFLDFGGGYGLFTRLMRDKGYNFYTTDKYCENIFAEEFDLNKNHNLKFEAVTAFEVLEHLDDPLRDLRDLFKYSSNLIFSTEIQPENLKTAEDWWYFAPEIGQHISFYSIKSLRHLGRRLNKEFYTDGSSLHMFTEKKLIGDPFKSIKDPWYIRKIRKYIVRYDQTKTGNKESLLKKDYESIRDKLKL